jgi:telomere length regulation protein
MLHAAHNSPVFLSVLAPDALELSLALAGKGAPSLSSSDPESSAAVLSASLELVLIALTHSQELDRGRSLCLDNTSLLLATGEWADQAISQLEAGLRYSGGGGRLEETLMKHAVGVASKVTEIGTPWKGSMVDVFS